MTDKSLLEEIHGKEVHIRLLTNDLLESDKMSLTAVGKGSLDGALAHHATLEIKHCSEYSPRGFFGKFLDRAMGRTIKSKGIPTVFVVVQERDGRMGADDARYIEWLKGIKGEEPKVLMLPEIVHHDKPEEPRHLLNEREQRQIHSFWERQWRRIKAIPAPVTKDAALAAIPRTLIPVAFTILLAYMNRHELTHGGEFSFASEGVRRVLAYIGVAFGFAIGFAVFNQTNLNYTTFWSEFTRDAFEPYLRTLDQWIKKLSAENSESSATKISLSIAKFFLGLFKFVSARGDVLIAAPSVGIICVYIARLALGPVGQTTSVLTLSGFMLVIFNVVVGSIAGGPYNQVIAHLRAVGKISNRASMYLGIFETVKMELGRFADFGMQTFYNVAQVSLAIVCWLLLLVSDRLYPKPDVYCLEQRHDIEVISKLLSQLRAREDIKKALSECAN